MLIVFWFITHGCFKVTTKSVKQCVGFYYVWKKIFSDDNKRLKALRRRRDLKDDLTTIGGQQAVMEALNTYSTRAHTTVISRQQDPGTIDDHVFSPPQVLAPQQRCPPNAALNFENLDLNLTKFGDVDSTQLMNTVVKWEPVTVVGEDQKIVGKRANKRVWLLYSSWNINMI